MSTKHRRDTVFVSYCQKDAKWLKLLTKHLQPYLRTTPMLVWDNSRINAGAVIQTELREALTRAAVAVLLVTPDYLDSEAIANEELPRFFDDARKGGLKLLWIAIKASAVAETSIADYQPLNDHKKPLIGCHYAHRDQELNRMCRVIKETWLKQCMPEPDSALDPPLPEQRMREAPPADVTPPPAAAESPSGLSSAEARRRAHAVLGGRLSDLRLWRDESRKLYMAASISAQLDDGGQIQVLQQTGLTFRKVWASEDLLSPPEKIDFIDIDSDGVPELLFEESSLGRLGGDRRLTIYFPRRRLAFRFTESWTRGPAVPVAPSVSIEPEIDDALLQQIEPTLMSRGFLQGVADYDPDSPKYAPQRWHMDNSGPGKLTVHFFHGAPVCLGSVVATLDAGGYEWIAEFKGALYAYDAKRARHFVVFSAEDFYNWPKCLAYHDGVLWFGVHMEPAIYSYNINKRLLRRHEVEANSFGVDKIEIDEASNELILSDHDGDELRRTLDELNQVASEL